MILKIIETDEMKTRYSNVHFSFVNILFLTRCKIARVLFFFAQCFDQPSYYYSILLWPSVSLLTSTYFKPGSPPHARDIKLRFVSNIIQTLYRIGILSGVFEKSYFKTSVRRSRKTACACNV